MIFRRTSRHVVCFVFVLLFFSVVFEEECGLGGGADLSHRKRCPVLESDMCAGANELLLLAAK